MASGLLAATNASASLLNGDFSQVGPYGNGVVTNAIGASWSSAADWIQFAPEQGGSVGTYLIQNGGPSGLSNALYVTSPAPSDSAFYEDGAGIYQEIGAGLHAHAEFDLLVLQGTVTCGLYQESGPFLSFTTYSPSGDWIHITQDDNGISGGIAFEDLYNSNAIYEVANVQETQQAVPEPASVLPVAMGVGLIAVRRRRSGTKS